MQFMRDAYGKAYAPNSRETVRRQTLHQFEQAGIVTRNPDDPSRPTNSGKNAYQLTELTLSVVATFGRGSSHIRAVEEFRRKNGELRNRYRAERDIKSVSLTLPDGTSATLSPGAHNELQALVIREFGPRFAPGASVLYIGNTSTRRVVIDTKAFNDIGVTLSLRDKLPDIILLQRARNWLFLIEVVTSHGPITPKRHTELESTFSSSRAGRVFVTAFADSGTFRKYAADIAWETEVWIADNPDHLVHFDGKRFLGPYGE